MEGVYWNDWGDEARVRTDIDFLEHQDHVFAEDEITIKME
jgi:hypothetical protein